MISVVAPVYRNAGTLCELAQRLTAVLKASGREYELIFVVDASPDNSAELVAELAAKDPRIKGIELSKNVGQNRALLTGLAAASGDLAVVIDADLQDPPEAVPALLDYLDQHPETEVVFAGRTNRYSSFGRYLTGRLFKGAIRAFSGFRLPARAGLFFALRQKNYREIAAWRHWQVHAAALISRSAGDGKGALAALPFERLPATASGYTSAMRLNSAWNALRTLGGFPAKSKGAVQIKQASNLPRQIKESLQQNSHSKPALPDRNVSTGAILAAAVFAFFARIILGIFSGWMLADEAWFLQIVTRMGHGERLYGDVFYGAMPLPMYAARIACGIFGYSALTIKGICAFFDAGVFAATAQLLVTLGQRFSPWKLSVVMILIPLPLITSLYGSPATMAVLLAAIAFLHWRRKSSIKFAALTGICVGLALGSKQNIGAFVSLAVAVAMVCSPAMHFTRRFGHLVIAGFSAAICWLMLLLPTVLNGSWHNMITYCFGIKKQYVAISGIDFSVGFLQASEGLLDWLTHNVRIWQTLLSFNWLTGVTDASIFLLSIFAGIAGLALLLQKNQRRELWPVLPFLLVLAVSPYPRVDANHLSGALPAMIVVLVLVARRFPRSLQKAAAFTAWVPAIAILFLFFLACFRNLISKNYQFVRVSPARGILMTKAEAQRLETTATEIRKLPGPIYIISTSASGLYLVGGQQNITPFDYPLANEFPPGAQEKLAADVIAGRIQTVLLAPTLPESFMPETLRTAIIQNCPLVGHLQGMEIRRSPHAKN